jgi:ABC-type transport system involved in multi-copper enzyme maturation permease subunit
MMKQFDAIMAIALNTFRETMRERIIYAFMLFALALTMLAILLGTLSVGQDVRILEDFGMASISLIGGIIAVFAGTNLVYKELERRTVYIIFTKPVTGWQFITGKYLGLSLSILLIVALMGTFLGLLVWLSSTPDLSNLTVPFATISLPLVLVYIELLFIVALATFFSTFASPLMSVVFTTGLWLIAHFGDSLVSLGRMSQNPSFAQLTEAVYAVLPDLASLTKARGILMYGQQPPYELLSWITCYVLGYATVLLVFAAVVTEEREFP